MATSNQFLSYLLNILNTVTYTGIELRVFQRPCEVICPEIAAQALSQRSSYTGVATQKRAEIPGDEIVSKLLRNPTSSVLLFLFGGRVSQAVVFEI